jgi:hypothetical protein
MPQLGATPAESQRSYFRKNIVSREFILALLI